MSDPLHLTEAELRDACEFIQRKKQMEWCTQQGLHFRIAGNGRVKVLRADYISRQDRATKAANDDGFNPDAI